MKAGVAWLRLWHFSVVLGSQQTLRWLLAAEGMLHAEPKKVHAPASMTCRTELTSLDCGHSLGSHRFNEGYDTALPAFYPKLSGIGGFTKGGMKLYR